MTRTSTVLVMTRGRRLHRLQREMVQELATRYRVVVLAAPEEVSSFAAIPGVDVRPYEGVDVQPYGAREIPARFQNGRSRSTIRALARDIEDRLGLPVYKAAGNYLLYGRIVRGYGGRWSYLENEDVIVGAYVHAYEILSALFEEVRPDVVFYETIDLISTYLAFVLARRRGAFALEFRFSPLGEGRITPAFGLFRRNPVLEYLYGHPEHIAAASYREADTVLEGIGDHLRESSHARIHRRMIDGRSPLNPKRVVPALLDSGRLSAGARNLVWHYRSLTNRLWLERHLARQIPDGPFVVFFLQHLPEASTCSQAPRWVYMESVAEQLAINAPSHLKIVVKEHPRSYGQRGPGFFAGLRNLPNVVVCHPSVDNQALLSRAEAALVINGTVGLDALLLGTRLGVLGRPFYSIYPGARVLDHPEELFTAMQDPAWRPQEMTEERRRFLAAYLQSMCEFTPGRGTSVYPESGGEKWAHALSRTMDFIQAHGLSPEQFDAGLPARSESP